MLVLITFRDKGVRVLAGPFLRPKFCGMHKISKGFKIPLFPLSSQFTEKFLKFEEMEYLIDDVKLNVASLV